ncbi:MAG: hypothetical protein P8J84_13545, partial [Paracoccaceae bacterium]|nr:hypothetical protein [Paracoccaceae bacterium]
MNHDTPIVTNGRSYPIPKTTAIAICLDGCEPAYLNAAIADGLMPTLKNMRSGMRAACSAVAVWTCPAQPVPSFLHFGQQSNGRRPGCKGGRTFKAALHLWHLPHCVG